MTGVWAPVLQLLLAQAPVVITIRHYYSTRLELELQIGYYYFILILKHTRARAPVLKILLAQVPVIIIMQGEIDPSWIKYNSWKERVSMKAQA